MDPVIYKHLVSGLVYGGVTITLATILGTIFKLIHMGLQRWVLKTTGKVGKSQDQCPDNSCKETQLRDQEEFKEVIRDHMDRGFEKVSKKMEDGLNRVHDRIDAHLNKTKKSEPA